MHKLAVVGCLSALALAAPSQAAPRSLRCDFADGTFRAWDKASRQTFDTLTLIFDSIDPAQGRARLVGNTGATDVSVVAAPRKTTFIEITTAGNVNTTTVYESAIDMKAVHSRHTGTPENPTLSQAYGYCKPY